MTTTALDTPHGLELTIDPADLVADYWPDSSGRYTVYVSNTPAGLFVTYVYDGDNSDLITAKLTRTPEHDAAIDGEDVFWATARLRSNIDLDDQRFPLGVIWLDGAAYGSGDTERHMIVIAPDDETPMGYGEAFARVLNDQRESYSPTDEPDEVALIAHAQKTITAEQVESNTEHDVPTSVRLSAAYLLMLDRKFWTPDWGIHGPIENTWGVTDKGLDDGLWDFLVNIDDADQPSDLNGIAVPCGVDPRRVVESLGRLAAEGLVVESEQGWVGVVADNG